jgi:hypothetical protein
MSEYPVGQELEQVDLVPRSLPAPALAIMPTTASLPSCGFSFNGGGLTNQSDTANTR